MTGTGGPSDVVAAALAGRRELALLADPSVAALAAALATWCRDPAPWIRSAIGTLNRFAEEVAGGDLEGLLGRGRAEVSVAEQSLAQLAFRHDGCTSSQLAALAFGPRLWWRASGVEVSWRPLGPSGADPARPIPGAADDLARDVRLVLLAMIGTGVTTDELLDVRIGDAGSVDALGAIVPDLEAEPLAFVYHPADGPQRLSFLSVEAAAAVRARLAERQYEADDLLLLPSEAVAAARAAADGRSSALIAAGNDINVATCRATGDFFRTWGMPGARYDARLSSSLDSADPRRDPA